VAIEITMNAVASYLTPSILQSDKKVVLVYGLNGTGKSTLSNYLYSPTERKFASCVKKGFDDSHVYVYNTKFLRDNFYEIDKLSGVFTLSKANKDIEEQIKEKTKTLSELDEEQQKLISSIENKSVKFNGKKTSAEEAVWDLKKKYYGGDRVLEYCVRGNIKSKEVLFEYISKLPEPKSPLTKSVEMLKKEVDAIQGEQAKTYQILPKLQSSLFSAEEADIFGQAIVGNQDSPIANLIKKLGNGDWVSQGLPYVDLLQSEHNESCPFCQEKTLSAAVAKSIKDYFDVTFTTSIESIKILREQYNQNIQIQPNFDIFTDIPFYEQRKVEIEAYYSGLVTLWKANQESIDRKVRAPSTSITLLNSSEIIHALNAVIDEVNVAITAHNAKIANREASLELIKEEFWQICRWEYKAVIDTYIKDAVEYLNEQKLDREKLSKISNEKQTLNTNLVELQKKTVNIEDAIQTINARLIDLGIDSFKIIKADGSRYKVSRNGVEGEDFLTLSEGEKTVISFLYFIELCKGKRSPTQIGDKKIVVIDDPISSLSHLYIFNIGELIKAEFSNSNIFDHVIVMTHSLYFFYELTENNPDKRHEKQKLFRIIKNSAGSKIVNMKYEEIQNDYQAYWNVIMDQEQHPALIANCMRNIIEYFFNFIKKTSLANIFQQPKFKDQKHLAFYRFMNRESHSLGQNIFDHKEFDYAKFKESFKLVFDEAGFPEHYSAMTKGL
jgi:wobble nucleotide-excising tRNase